VAFANAAAADTSATFSLEGSYLLRLTASDGELTASDDVSVTVQVEGSPAALFVVGGGNDAADGVVQGRLEQLGYSVLRKVDTASTPADANGKDFVLISGTADPTLVKDRFRSAAAAVIIAQPLLFDDMGLTGGQAGAEGVALAQTD